jgi:hypothetical protein
MNEYYTIDKNGNTLLVTNGIQRVVTFATIENEEWLYIYPTLGEQEKGVQVVRKLKSQTARD